MFLRLFIIVQAALLLVACQSAPNNPSVDVSSGQLVQTIINDLTTSGFVDDSRLFGDGMVGALRTSTPLIKLKPIFMRIDGSQSIAERDMAILELSEALVDTGYVAHVFFRTEKEGALVKYQLITDDQPKMVINRTNSLEPEVFAIGIYHIWTERDGQATSSPDTRYHITKKVVDLILE